MGIAERFQIVAVEEQAAGLRLPYPEAVVAAQKIAVKQALVSAQRVQLAKQARDARKLVFSFGHSFLRPPPRYGGNGPFPAVFADRSGNRSADGTGLSRHEQVRQSREFSIANSSFIDNDYSFRRSGQDSRTSRRVPGLSAPSCGLSGAVALSAPFRRVR